MEDFKKQVAAMLATAAANDAVLAKDMSRSDKSIEEFCKLFYDAARKAAKGVGGNVGVFGKDEELIGAAAHYFHEDDVKELKLDSLVVCASTEKPQPKPPTPKATAPKATPPTAPTAPTAPKATPPTAPKATPPTAPIPPKVTPPVDGIYDEDFF